MLSGQTCAEGVRANRRANAAMLIGCHGHTDTGTADQNSYFADPVLNVFADAMGEYGIIAAIGRIGSDIDHIEATLLQMVDNFQLQMICGVVTADGNDVVFHI